LTNLIEGESILRSTTDSISMLKKSIDIMKQRGVIEILNDKVRIS
jgi:hypothetical protein